MEAGWIVLNDGSQRGGSGNIVNPVINNIQIQPAPFIDPAAENVSVPQAGRLRVTKFIDPHAE